MLRRHLLEGATAFSAGLFPIGRTAWAAVNPTTTPTQRRLVVILLRGAVDGLSVVVPYAESDYYRARSSIALGRPGADGGLLDLDGRFGLHPALAPLMPLWQSGKLGFVHASGSRDTTRSHFDAQDYIESVTPGRKATPDGWPNRLLGALPGMEGERTSPTRAVSVGPVLPRIYAGRNPVANIASGNSAGKPTLLDRPKVGDAFAQLYAGDDKMSRAYQESREAHHEVMDSMSRDSMSSEMEAANNGAPFPNSFPDDTIRLARLMRNDGHVQLAFMALVSLSSCLLIF